MISGKIIESDVPTTFVRRMGDWTQEGGNNTIIILGTDRAKKGGPAGPEDGLGYIGHPQKGKKSGTIHLIAGRKDHEGNPDLGADDAYLYLSMRTDVDGNLDLGSVEKTNTNIAAAILKSNAVRLVFRDNIKIVREDKKSYVYMDDEKTVVCVGATKITTDGTSVSIEGDLKVTGAITSETSVTAPTVEGSTSVTSPSISADTSMKVGTVELSTHTHPFTAAAGNVALVTSTPSPT